MAEEKNNFKIPIVKISYFIIDFFQKITTTYLIRKIIKPKNPDLVKKIVTFVNVFWFLLIILELFFKYTHPLVVILMVFRLWEISIINIWMFIFKQGASKSQNTNDDENNIRLFILLLFQYFTIILIFSCIYYILFTIDSNNFIINSSPNLGGSIITWIYFSIVTIATTGYGDIFPTTSIAKVSTISEILFGMLFVLLFITNILSKMNFSWRDNIKSK